jgi:hypothetical protein
MNSKLDNLISSCPITSIGGGIMEKRKSLSVIVALLASIFFAASVTASTYNYNTSGFFVSEDWDSYNTNYWWIQGGAWAVTGGYLQFSDSGTTGTVNGVFFNNSNFKVGFLDEWEYSSTALAPSACTSGSGSSWWADWWVNLINGLSLTNSSAQQMYMYASPYGTHPSSTYVLQATNKFGSYSYSGYLTDGQICNTVPFNFKQVKRNLPNNTWYVETWYNGVLNKNISSDQMTSGAGADAVRYLSNFTGFGNFALQGYDTSGNNHVARFLQTNFTVTHVFEDGNIPPSAPVVSAPSYRLASKNQESVQFTVADPNNASLSCSVYVDGSLAVTNSSVQNNTLTSLTPSWTTGMHNYFVRCNDGLNTLDSATQMFQYYPTLKYQLYYDFNGTTLNTSMWQPVTNNVILTTTDGASVLRCMGNGSMSYMGGVSLVPTQYHIENTDEFQLTWLAKAPNTYSYIISQLTSNNSMLDDTANPSELPVFLFEAYGNLGINSLQATVDGGEQNVSGQNMHYFNNIFYSIPSTYSRWWEVNMKVGLNPNGTRWLSGSYNSTYLGNVSSYYNYANRENPRANIFAIGCRNDGSNSYDWSIDWLDLIVLENRAINVTLSNPPNHAISGSQQNVTFTATNSKYSTMSCTLRVDNIVNQTNASVLNNTLTTFPMHWSSGSHLWNITCTDSELTGYSETRTFTFNSTHSFVLWNPANATRTNVQEPISYEVYDSDHALTSCSLYIDTVLNETNASVMNDTISYFYPVWAEGFHSWYVQCNDGETVATSETRYYDMDSTEPFTQTSSPSSFNTSVFTGYAMNIMGNVTDNNLYRVNRTIRYPNGTVFYNNYSGDLPVNTTLYSWDNDFNTTALPNGIYEMYIESADSHTANIMPDALNIEKNLPLKKLSYTLNYGAVSIALTGGNGSSALSDFTTFKNPDRYRWRWDFNKNLQKGDTLEFTINADQSLKYLAGSKYQGHFIINDKYWLDFESTDVKVNSVVQMGVTTFQVNTEVIKNNANKITFDSLGGLNEADLLLEFEINNCEPDWSCNGFTACNTTDEQTCNSVVDQNTCGLPYEGDYSEFGVFPCNYCSRDIVVFNESACSATTDDKTVCYLDNNFATCCNVTGLGSDCYADVPQSEDTVCVAESCSFFSYTSNDITGAVINFVSKGFITLSLLAGAITIGGVGLWAYNRFKMGGFR